MRQSRRIAPATRKKQKTRRLVLVLLLFLIVLVGSIYLIKHYDVKRNDIYSSVSEVKKIIVPEKKKDYKLLQAEVAAIIAKYPSIDIAFAYTDNETSQLITAGKDGSFVAASTAKVIVAADFLHQVETGKYTLNQKVGGVGARWQLRQMIQQSNNDSWMAFNELLGYSQENAYAKSVGIPSYNSYKNTVKVSEQVAFLKKLYNREILNEENTSLLLYYMQNTNNEDMIPAALPELTVMHKYGNLDGNLHDIGIVATEKPYFLGVHTNSTSVSSAKKTQVIKEIVTAVNNFKKK